ncbi:MAG: hypothetical protein HRT35_13305, partial [Algicola sp.]|nr:hypothetical protein [Algicola sp.]
MSIEQKMVPLSSTQEGIFVDQMLNPEMASYNIGTRLRLCAQDSGDINVDRLKLAVEQVAGQHDALRTVLVQHHGEIFQQVLSQVAVEP